MMEIGRSIDFLCLFNVPIYISCLVAMFYIKLDDEPYHYSNYYDNKTKVSCLPLCAMAHRGRQM